MRYISIDIETTGLDPETCQILEIGAVIAETSDGRNVMEWPYFHCYVRHDLIVGQPYALDLNKRILEQLALTPDSAFIAEDGTKIMPPMQVASAFEGFLKEHKYDGKIIPAGKNFSSFDRVFLNKLPGWKDRIKFHHRTLDPMMLYINAEDLQPAGLEACCNRAGINIEGLKLHTALQDARLVVQLIERGLKG